MTISRSNDYKIAKNGTEMKLSREQILMLEEALSSIGAFGEVRLVVEKGRLRYIVTQKSVDTLKWSAEKGSGW